MAKVIFGIAWSVDLALVSDVHSVHFWSLSVITVAPDKKYKRDAFYGHICPSVKMIAESLEFIKNEQKRSFDSHSIFFTDFD